MRKPAIDRIARCILMAASSSEGEARAAVNRARHLMRRYGVTAADLPPDIAAKLEEASRFDIDTATPGEAVVLAYQQWSRRFRRYRRK